MNTTLNLHFTDKCNFVCIHCFVDRKNRQLTLDQCKNTVVQALNEGYKRINLAGGEPLMVPYLQEIIDFIVEKGLECSIITNGSLLTEDFIQYNQNKLTMIGISIDSMNDATNSQIGRQTIRNIISLSEFIKQNKIQLKINICVSRANIHEDLSEWINCIQPNRLKIMQVVPNVASPHSMRLTIDSQEFEDYCMRYHRFNPVCENTKHITESYCIVDSEGVFCHDNLHDRSKDAL